MASLQEVSVAELADVDGGLLPLLGGIVLAVGVYACMKGVQSLEPKPSGITNFQLLGITPPK